RPLNLLTYFADHLQSGICHLCAARLAPLTGPIALLLRCIGREKETHLLAPWPSRRTRRTAINVRGAHTIEQCSVKVAIAREHRSPVRISRIFSYGLHGLTILFGLKRGPSDS